MEKIFAVSFNPKYIELFECTEALILKETKERFYFKQHPCVYRNFINKSHLLIPMEQWTSSRNTGSTIFCFEKDIEKAKKLVIGHSESILKNKIKECEYELKEYKNKLDIVKKQLKK